MDDWKWSKAEEVSLARFVNDEAIQLLPELPINPLNLVFSPGDRLDLVRCIYEQLLTLEIKYNYEKFDPNKQQQRIRTPTEVLDRPKQGTCLDLALVFCGLCLACDLLPLVIVIKGHALAAVSLNHQRQDWNSFAQERSIFSNSPSLNGEEGLKTLQKWIEDGTYIAIECTGFAQTPDNFPDSVPEGKERRPSNRTLTFERASAAGKEQLENSDRPFQFAIDIAAAQYGHGLEPYSFNLSNGVESPQNQLLLSAISSQKEEPSISSGFDFFRDSPKEAKENSVEDCVDLLIELEQESSKINKNESDKFKVNTWLAFVNNDGKYSHEKLVKTFQRNQIYTQAKIEENIYDLIDECFEQLEKINIDKDVKMAIEWILPNTLLSLPVDCWEYRKNTKTGCGDFRSVHIRSSQRLNRRYKNWNRTWKNKWDLLKNSNKPITFNDDNYILSSQCKDKNEQDLNLIDLDEKIVGINLPVDLQNSENIPYEFIIERGIPLVLWSRCQQHNVNNHPEDLDLLIGGGKDNFLNFKSLYKSIRKKRLEAKQDQPEHLGHHLCFLLENPYNYPKKQNYDMSG